ncbi:hypothetical protein K470DRAFT_219802 [Piedraia hortae CBS 480.64]|uniref:dipeptidyl-peptidase IV n=1 Tax=Piedraia hortae CBS 480.64 TaxID=1314780 RepID=A0A6A7BVF6_9PEZI|nr:hypothetical protein K470DRAFT_219802 [Piedraia hortae CBS 480.64]
MDDGEELKLLGQDEENAPRASTSSASSASATSLILEHLSHKTADDEPQWQRRGSAATTTVRRLLYVLIAIGSVGWLAALVLFVGQQRAGRQGPHMPATAATGGSNKVQLEQVLQGSWMSTEHAIRWVPGPRGEDGLLLERDGGGGRDYLVVEDVRFRGDDVETQKRRSKTLMKKGRFTAGGGEVVADETWPSPDHSHVLVRSDYKPNWRHSSTGRYWIVNVASQAAEPLDPDAASARCQLATWSPDGSAVVFTRDNNLFIRHLNDASVRRITSDGGPNIFYGVPDWVYEEEVLQKASATWWSHDGRFVAFLRTDETAVPEFPVQYFFSSPTETRREPGLENYPETRMIKYPKAGAPNPLVGLQFFDVQKDEVFSVPIANDFPDHDRIINEVLWAGNKVIVRSTNREADVLKTVLIDAVDRSGRTVRERNVHKLDGGWIEADQTTAFVPADPAKGRPHDGYIDTVIHGNWEHLAYFTPLDNPEPIMLTDGEWEVVKAPSAVDLANNLVYYVSTQASSTERHIYTVDLLRGPRSISPVTNTAEIGYYSASFSAENKYMLLTYSGPGIPYQKVLSTPSNHNDKLDISIETNPKLATLAKRTALPTLKYDTFHNDGYHMNVVERLPPGFDPSGSIKYPVVFFLYNGPGFQHVDRKFTVDFQSYLASNLGYVVVTLDARGTGYKGRKHRTIVRDNIGFYEATDQIAAAKAWAKKRYVAADKMAIWGWSYGGFMTLKALELDGGQTFKYGMAVAPVTDWRYYDSIYTERYMHTPKRNPTGYANASISNMTTLSSNVRFLVMHGFSDDNVHFQNTLSLLDKLDLANVRNYDVHVFPDSDHSIYFHNGNRIVYGKLRDWLINAFAGVWLGTEPRREL